MNKTKTILAAVGGVMLVAVLTAGFFAWCAYSAKTAALEGDDEGTEGLETVIAKAERLSRQPIYPNEESIRKLTEQRDRLVEWTDGAHDLVARGDRPIAPTTPAAFKEFVQADAQRLRGLPAGADKKTLDETFDFGPFKTYIADATMPDAGALPALQRQWNDIACLIETLSESGVESVTAIDLKKTAVAEPEQETGRKTRKKPVRKAAVEPTFRPSVETYVVVCRVRPASFVSVLNALASGTRFTVVSDFTVRREKDTLGEGLGLVKKEESAQAGGRRRRRGMMTEAVEAKKEGEEPPVTVVTDPAEDPAFETTLTVAVYDFRTMEKSNDKQEEAK